MPNYCANQAQSYCRDWQSVNPSYCEISQLPPTNEDSFDSVNVSRLTKYYEKNPIKLITPYAMDKRRWTFPAQSNQPVMHGADDTGNGTYKTEIFLLEKHQNDENTCKKSGDRTKIAYYRTLCSKIIILFAVILIISGLIRILADVRFDKSHPPATYKSGAQFLSASPAPASFSRLTRQNMLEVMAKPVSERAMVIYPDTVALQQSVAVFSHALYKVS